MKYEHKVITTYEGGFGFEANQLGRDGWELVAVMKNNDDRRLNDYYFKRQISQG